MPKMTIWGVEHFLNSDNISLFDGFNLPAGMDKDTLVRQIMMECGEFGLVYQDADFLRVAITAWWETYKSTFDKWWEVWNLKYNPIHNFDRNEVYTDTANDTETTLLKRKLQNTNTRQGTNVGLNSGTSENQVSAFDSDTYVPKDKNTIGNDSETRTSDNESGHGNEQTDDTRVNTRGSRHKGHLFGNIGVTKTQEMASDEIAFREGYNPYKLIADLFVKDFCIMIY